MVHALTIFISAFLLFLLQLVIGKRILPWFGGAPAVWTTCMLFFQLLLLAGYAYAHFLSARFSHAVQVRIHSGLLAASVLLLGFLWWRWGTPILPSAEWKPASPDQPIWQILKLLGTSVGLPFFILSTTSPLLQRWYSLQFDSTRTYRLYALSNVGSMLALLSYPFLIEPWFRLPIQANGWGLLYGVFAIGAFVCGLQVPYGEHVTSSAATRPEEEYKPRPKAYVITLWLLLATMTSSMLLSVTNNLCQEVAVVPFLWVLPLAIYLLTFVICFDSSRWYQRRWFVLATAASSIVVLVTAFQGVQLGIVAHIISYGTFLFLFCMTCHGELVQLKPAPKFLTLFYLVVACGGAAGGIFVGLIAPNLFTGYWEFHMTMLLGWVVLALVFVRDKKSFFFTGDRLHLYLLLGVVSYLAIRLLVLLGPARPVEFAIKNLFLGALSFSLIIVAVFAWWTRNAAFVSSRIWPRILVGAVIFFAECFMLNRIRGNSPMTYDIQRNFYGVTRVDRRLIDKTNLNVMQLAHGQISHGIQFVDDQHRNRPVGYYSASSGIGLAFRFHPRRTREEPLPLKIGVLGLGVGTLACFGHEPDTFRFYEINPAVVRYSVGEKIFFSYLRDCRSKVEIVMGDARLSLERELSGIQNNQFDILVMDAFSSDSVPVHLLTTEAFETYLGHCRDKDAIIAVNISNRFLDFRDLMFSTANHFELGIAIVDCAGDPPDNTPSRWCLLTRNEDFLQRQEVQRLTRPLSAQRKILWTDDFSNLFQLLK